MSFEILDWVLQDLDNDIRVRDIARYTKAIEFLEDEVIKTNSDELKKLFYSLIQEQTNKKMIAITNPAYLFNVIDPPYIPEVKSEPQSLLIIISLTMFGFLISLLFVLISNIARNKYINN